MSESVCCDEDRWAGRYWSWQLSYLAVDMTFEGRPDKRRSSLARAGRLPRTAELQAQTKQRAALENQVDRQQQAKQPETVEWPT
ncbi:hypothetical protein BE61_87320 [Bradyrhizobium elkanii USDA 61]|nr:hypothetical protein BE61_87320 [Bradyrhizobium elkanii USDA 61]